MDGAWQHILRAVLAAGGAAGRPHDPHAHSHTPAADKDSFHAFPAPEASSGGSAASTGNSVAPPRRGAALADLQIVDCYMSGGAAAALASLLRQRGGLHSLSLSGNRLSATSAGMLAASLQPHVGLTHLALDENALLDCGVDALATAVKGHNSLRVLSLRSCRLTDAGMAALRPLTNLQSLGLAHNYLADAGAAALAHTLCALWRLEALDLRNCGIEEEGAAALLPALGALACLSRLVLAQNHLGRARELCCLARGARLQALDLSRVWPPFALTAQERGQAADAEALVATLAALPEGATIDMRECRFTSQGRAILDSARLLGRRSFLLGPLAACRPGLLTTT